MQCCKSSTAGSTVNVAMRPYASRMCSIGRGRAAHSATPSPAHITAILYLQFPLNIRFHASSPTYLPQLLRTPHACMLTKVADPLCLAELAVPLRIKFLVFSHLQLVVGQIGHTIGASTQGGGARSHCVTRSVKWRDCGRWGSVRSRLHPATRRVCICAHSSLSMRSPSQPLMMDSRNRAACAPCWAVALLGCTN
jgi:hypothetical protein